MRIQRLRNKQYAIYSTKSPYFCFVGKDVNKLKHKLKGALNFYKNSKRV